MNVRCRACHRLERWSADGTRTVRVAGGARRSRTPERDRFATLSESFRGGIGPVVAGCPACGEPMVADHPKAPRIPWTLETPRGPVVFGADGALSGPDGASLEAAERLIAESHPLAPDEEPPLSRLFGGSLLLMMMAPFTLWVMAVLFVVLFLTNIGAPVPEP